ncbi:MAG: AMP-binding protein, partial [Opitutaceae bacterium]|nr:AMP-binding protein [Opitutaceae bacterium]
MKRHSVVCEADPRRFQTAFAEGVAAGGKVFLADPKWSPTEMAEFDRLRSEATREDQETDCREDLGWLHIPTGGTGGKLKLARHDELTIDAAVRGFAAHFFQEKTVHAFGVLPLHHVSGLMAWLRCALTRGTYTVGDWTSLQAGVLPTGVEPGGFLSLVPTQLERLLRNESMVDWLKTFRAVFVGGGPSWRGLLDRAATAGVPLVLSYGMTETAAMAVAQKPGEFLAGDRSCGRQLPH